MVLVDLLADLTAKLACTYLSELALPLFTELPRRRVFSETQGRLVRV